MNSFDIVREIWYEKLIVLRMIEDLKSKSLNRRNKTTEKCAQFPHVSSIENPKKAIIT